MKNSLISLLMMASFANLSAQTFNEQVHKWMMLQDSTASKSNEVRNIMAQVAYYYPDTTVASKGYWDTLTQKMDTMNLELMDSFVAVYRQHYDPTDLQNLIRFYESPTGKKFLTKQDLIHQEVAFARRMWQSKLVSQVIDTLKKDGLKDPREETRKDTASNSNQPVMLRTMKEANDAVYMNDLSKQIKSYEQTYQTSSIDIYS